MGCDAETDSTNMPIKRGDVIGDGSPLRARDDVSDAELEQRLNNYTMQDISYSQQLASNGTAKLS